jgi:hypothetical protein
MVYFLVIISDVDEDVECKSTAKSRFHLRYLGTLLIALLLTAPAWSVELFRYRAAAKDGCTLEYVFEADQQNSPNDERFDPLNLLQKAERTVGPVAELKRILSKKIGKPKAGILSKRLDARRH